MRKIIYYVMEYADLWTGHRVFRCYNGNRTLNRLWYWANVTDG